MMTAGPFAISGLPVSRLALRLERALASAGSGPDALASAVLRALDEPLDGPTEKVLAEAPALVSRAPSSDLFLTVGMVCPETGVPVMVALRISPAPDNRLLLVSRLDAEYEVAWRAGRTVVAAQGSGRAVVEAMVDGLADEHWEALAPDGRKLLRPAMEARWDRAHASLGVASPRELAAVASGLVRGAEAIGFLTRESEVDDCRSRLDLPDAPRGAERKSRFRSHSARDGIATGCRRRVQPPRRRLVGSRASSEVPMSDDAKPILELPVEGFPISAEAVRAWYVDRHGQVPSERELGRILIAMSAREATPPVTETAADEPGWAIGPNSHPRSGA